MKSGWKTTEFWVALIPLLAALACQFGLAPDTATAEQELTRVLAGISSAVTAVAYIWSRYRLKQDQSSGRGVLPAVVLALLFAGPARTAPPVLPWRQQMDKRVDELSRRLSDQNQLLAALIGQRPAPLPIAGEPRQALPIPGEPKQALPIPGEPRQALPPAGTPRQDLPTAPPRLPSAPTGPQAYTQSFQRALYRVPNE